MRQISEQRESKEGEYLIYFICVREKSGSRYDDEERARTRECLLCFIYVI